MCYIFEFVCVCVCEFRQENLRLVLKAYAMYNVKTGYCQVREGGRGQG